MAKNNPEVETPTPKTSVLDTLADRQARDQFIGIALREYVAFQVANNKQNYEQAAIYAVRFANAVMVARSAETAPLKLTVSRGVVAPVVEVDHNNFGPPDSAEPPKTVAEIVGDAPELDELK